MVPVDFYFYHIPKCAGMALREVIYQSFKDRYRDDEIHIPGYNVPGPENIPRLIASGDRDVAYFENLKVIADHSRPGQLADFLDTTVSVKFAVTAIRHPVDRVLSAFHFFKDERWPDSLQELSPYQFDRYLRLNGNAQAAHLSNTPNPGSVGPVELDRALEALRGLDAIVLFEDFARSIEVLNRANPFDVAFSHPLPRNVTSKKTSVAYKRLYSEDFRKSLEKYCAHDLRLYAEGSMIFKQLCEQHEVA
jgi:hypothetical protein